MLKPTQQTPHVLVQTIEELSTASRIDEVTAIVVRTARQLAGADGSTFVLREDDKCFYVDEDAISPLWKNRRFPLTACISGWSMLHKEVVVLRDIYEDSRIPKDAYLPTFVKSLCMVPIRALAPIGAIGIYWSNHHVPSEQEVKLLQALANNAAIALENIELRGTVERRQSEKKELEFLLFSMAHDLKNSVGGLASLGELVQMAVEPVANSEALELLQMCRKVTDSVFGQIDKMVALHRSEARGLNPVEVDLSEMARETMQRLQAGLRNREVRFEVQDGLAVQADPDLMRIVLENLFSNALKYSARMPVSEVRLGSLQDPTGKTVFFVRDNGAGFSPDAAHLLFKPFSRLHAKEGFAGQGIGLASVARIIENHHGKIWAEGAPGQGATFYFSLPAGKK